MSFLINKLKELEEHIKSNFSTKIKAEISVERDILVIKTDIDSLNLVILFLYDDLKCSFKQLTDICGVDYPERESRFEVVYHLLSNSYNLRARVKVSVKEKEAVPGISGIFASACWYEREVFDMYGIDFSNTSDLRRILTDYNFEGYPMRKDFPLSGYTEVRYDNEKNRIIHQPVKLDQEYRNFDFISPWEGADYNISSKED